MGKIRNGNLHYCVFDVCPLSLTWRQRLVGVGAFALALHLALSLLTPHPTAVTLGQHHYQTLSPLSCLFMPITATACKYINYTASERGHYQRKCERGWYPKHYHGTFSHTPVSQVPSEDVCVNRWRYQDVHSVACQRGETTVVNRLCKSRLNLLTLFALCCVSGVYRALTILLYVYYGSKMYMWKHIIVYYCMCM